MFVKELIKDYGTPEVKSDKLVTVEIDDKKVQVPEGTTVLRAAYMAGIRIPKLCATDTLKPFGSCRLCIVEIEGRRGFPASCTTIVEDGMKIRTNSEKLARLRRNIMELYISDHPLDCLTCPADGECELQDMAGYVGLREVRYGFNGQNHLDLPKDTSNPYFVFDPSKCIVCYRCVRACDEIQGTFALTVEGRGFNSQVKPGPTGKFITSECVSCGACVFACPTSALIEKSIINEGLPDRRVKTVCAFCGVGCSFYAEIKGGKVIRMVPDKEGKANHGHSCVKGRFAWVYAYNKDRVTKPMIRENINEPWREVSWDEAINFVANRFKEIIEKYGRESVGAVTSSRCTNEEVFILQKLVRAVFGNNNVDTCARVCHSPTGYGLKTAFGTSAGTNEFDSVMKADVIMVVGANPTEAHPVFGSLLKRRLREGAKLIVVDPRRTELVKSPPIKADYHLQLKPGTNVAVLNAMAHTIVSEGLEDKKFIESRCDLESYKKWREFILRPENSPEEVEKISGVPAKLIREAARLYATAERSAIYYGLGVTEHSQGSTGVLSLANLAMITGNVGKEGAGVNPLRGQNNVQGSCDMGSFPHELSDYRHISDENVRRSFEREWGVALHPNPGLRLHHMLLAALEGKFKGIYVHGYDIVQSEPDVKLVVKALKNMELVVVHDIFMNETAKYAHVFLPGCTFLEKTGTFTNAERRVQLVQQAIKPLCGKGEWEVIAEISKAMGYDMNYKSSSDIMDEIARLTPNYSGISHDKLRELGSVQWPCNEKAPYGTPTIHKDGFVRGKGFFSITKFIPTPEKTTEEYPLILTTGRVLYQYNVGAQTRRTPNIVWYSEDILEINPEDAKERGIKDGDLVRLESRRGWTTLRAKISNRVPKGIVYTNFHFPEIMTNVVTSDYSDWATNCPEYKVTAVNVTKVSMGEVGKYIEKEEIEMESAFDIKDVDIEIIISMANNIGAFFEVYPYEEAVDGVVSHLSKFWHPLMIERLIKYSKATNGEKLLPVVRDSLKVLEKRVHEKEVSQI